MIAKSTGKSNVDVCETSMRTFSSGDSIKEESVSIGKNHLSLSQLEMSIKSKNKLRMVTSPGSFASLD